MRRFSTYATAYSLQLLAGLLLCILFVACSSGNPDYCTIASPTGYPTLTVADGIMYMQSASSNSLYALRTSDGSLLWKYPASVLWAVEHGTVYIEGGNDSFYALRANDGTVLWQYDMSKDVSSVVAVVDGLVYFSSSNNLTLYTLRASDGRRLWQQKFDVDHYPSTVLAANGIAYVAAEYSRITAYRESDGSQLWRYETGSEPPGNPLSMTLGNGIVYASSDQTTAVCSPACWQDRSHGIVYASSDQTTALRASDGAVLWHFPGTGPVVEDNGLVYVSADSLYQLDALRTSDGAVLWHWRFPSSEPYTLTLANGVIYAGPNGGNLGLGINHTSVDTYRDHLYALKGEDGALLWNQPLEHARAVLSASDGKVFVLSPDALDAWQASNGTRQWHHPLQQVGLLIAGGTIYAGTAGVVSDCFPTKQSKLTALQVTSGTQLWLFQTDAVSNS
jgi:outer membrane protein assembly factor BamB